MLTPQEVSERSFQKSSFGGYSMAQVDEFLDILTGDYSALYSENAVLKSKMKVLVDKVEEYRSTEEAMRKALMTAQRMADDLVREAEQKRDEILREVESQTAQRHKQLRQELESEQFRLEQAQQATIDFVASVRALQTGQEQFLTNLQQLCPPEVTPTPVDPVDEAADEIDDNVQRLLAQAMLDATTETVTARQQEDELSLEDTAEFSPVSAAEGEDNLDTQDNEDEDISAVPGNHIDFGTLQFGRDYEIK